MLVDYGIPFLFWLQRKLTDLDLFLSRCLHTLNQPQDSSACSSLCACVDTQIPGQA